MANTKRSASLFQVHTGEPDGELVERRIHFYAIDAGRHDDGRPIIYDPVPALEHLNTLDHKVEGRYMVSESKNLLCADPYSLEYPQKVVYYFSRRNDLPEMERAGQWKPLNLPADAGLGERCHLVFFREYVAADFNFHAPRPTTFPAYLAAKAKGLVPNARFSQLLRGEATEQLNRIDGLTLARMKLSKTTLGILADAEPSLAQSFQATFQSTDADEIEIVMRRRRKSVKDPSKYLNRHVLDAFKWLSSRAETYEEFDKLQARGVGKLSKRLERLIDVLDDQLIVNKRMIKINKRSRGIDTENAFQQIESAFEEARPGILGAGQL